MHRREALRFLSTTALAPLLGPLSARERWSAGQALHRRLARESGGVLAPAQLAQVRALADAILPGTDSPGALEVGAPEFFDLLLAEWYPLQERDQLLAGLDALDAGCRQAQGKPFAELEDSGRAAFLATVDGVRGAPGSQEAAYSRIKDALIFGFITSQPIAELRRTVPVIPGRFDGCRPMEGSR